MIAAFTAAVLRTLDGAQMTVVARKIGAAAAQGMITAEPFASDPQQAASLPAIYSGTVAALSIGFTGLIAGAFLLMSIYFRSEHVKQVLAFLDSRAS